MRSPSSRCGAVDAAQEHLSQCATLEADLNGPSSQGHGIALNNLAELELETGRHERALQHFERAREVFASRGSSGSSLLIYPERGMGLSLLALDRAADALPTPAWMPRS